MHCHTDNKLIFETPVAFIHTLIEWKIIVTVFGAKSLPILRHNCILILFAVHQILIIIDKLRPPEGVGRKFGRNIYRKITVEMKVGMKLE